MQLPPSGKLCLDHIAHYVEKMDQANDELKSLGFTLTPFSKQSHKLTPESPLEPAGAGNRCIMLEKGYIEILNPIGTTSIANQLRSGLKRYTGIHLIAFGTALPEKDHARLSDSGFAPLNPVSLQRNIETKTKTETARFTVIRVPHGTMPEGRIQFCHHLTPKYLWQSQWTHHANHAKELKDIIICVTNPEETANRYARFTGLTADLYKTHTRIKTTRGSLIFVSSYILNEKLEITPPCLPWIAGYVLKSSDQSGTANYLKNSKFPYREFNDGRLLVKLPKTVGGCLIFESENAEMLNL